MITHIAYVMHHDREAGVINTQGKPGHVAAEAMQRLYRSKGKPDGISWQAADNFISAMIATAKLGNKGGK